MEDDNNNNNKDGEEGENEGEDFVFQKNKCNNVNVIDLSMDDHSRKRGDKIESKKMENFQISRVSDNNKYFKGKIPDSSCKNLTVNCSNMGQHNSIGETAKISPTRTLSLRSNNGGCSRTTPVTFKHFGLQESDLQKSHNGSVVDPSPLMIKREPGDFQKYTRNSPLLSFSSLDTIFNPNALRVLDGQILNTVPYTESSFELSEKKKNYSSSPNLEDGFFSNSNQNFLSPRPPASDNPFLNSKFDYEKFNDYKNYTGTNYSKTTDNYKNVEKTKTSWDYFSKSHNCGRNEEDDERSISQDNNNSLVNSTTSEIETKTSTTTTTTTTKSNSINVTPCQVAEVTSASSLLSPKIPSVNPVVIKQEEVVSVPLGSGTTGVNDQKKDGAFMPSGQFTGVSSTGKNYFPLYKRN